MSGRVKKSVCILLLIALLLPSVVLFCGCVGIRPVAYTDENGACFTVYSTHATFRYARVTGGNGGQIKYVVPSYVKYKSRKIKVTQIEWDESSRYHSFLENAHVKRLVIPSTITKIDLSGYNDLSLLEEIDVSQNRHFEMVGGALYTKNKRKLLFCLYNYTGALRIFWNTKSMLDKDGNLDSSIFNGSHKFENVQVDKANTWCASVDGALYTKDKTTLLYYSPYKTDESYTFPKQFHMTDPMSVLASNTYLKQVFVENGSEYYKSVNGVLYTIDGASIAYYPQNVNATAFEIPSELKHIVRTNSFMMQQNLQSVTVAQGNTAYKSVDGVLYSADGKELVFYPLAKQGEHFAIPSTVKTVGNYAMHNAQNLQTVFIPASVTNLASYSLTGNIEYYVEGERSEMYLRLEVYGKSVHYGVSLEEYLEIVANWGE